MDRIRTLAQILDDPPTPEEHRQSCEASYRRGVHQALSLACELVEESPTVREARRQLGRAERLAGELRRTRKRQGGGHLLDWIRGRLASPRPAKAKGRPW